MSSPSTSATGADGGNRRVQRLLSYSTKNMIYSLLVVFGLAFAVWALMPGTETPVPREATEMEAVAAETAADVEWDLVIPQDLGDDWRVTMARTITIAGVDTWRVGLEAPSGDFVALSQTADATAGWRDAVLGESGSLGTQALPGLGGEHEWEQWIGDGATALLLGPAEAGGATTVVHGNGAETELVEVIAHLVVQSG